MTEPPDQPDDSPDLEQLRRSLLASYQLDDEQLRRIEEQLDEVEEASRRIGRRDWLLYFVGTVLALVITAVVTAVPRSLPYEILAGALAITAVIATAIVIVRSRRPSELPDPDEPLRHDPVPADLDAKSFGPRHRIHVKSAFRACDTRNLSSPIIAVRRHFSHLIAADLSTQSDHTNSRG